jgi:transcriptional regulator with XRE-family HTH domain
MNANTLLMTLLEDIAKAGLSVARVCKRADIDPSLVSRWKAGRVEPRLSSLSKMRAALDVLKADDS